MQALAEEQNARMQGQTTGRIQSASGSKQGLSFKVLQWLTGTDSEDNSETASNCKSRYPSKKPDNLFDLGLEVLSTLNGRRKIVSAP